MSERMKQKEEKREDRERHINKPYGVQLVDLSLAVEQGLFDKQLAKDTTSDKKRTRVSTHPQMPTRTYPQDHMSTEGPYLSAPSSSSGGRYHSVITRLV